MIKFKNKLFFSVRMGNLDERFMSRNLEHFANLWFDWYMELPAAPEAVDIVETKNFIAQAAYLVEEADLIQQRGYNFIERGEYNRATECSVEALTYLYFARIFNERPDVDELIEFSYGEAFLLRGTATYLKYFHDNNPFTSEGITDEQYDCLMDAIDDFEAAKVRFGIGSSVMRLRALDFSHHCQEIILKHYPSVAYLENPKTI